MRLLLLCVVSTVGAHRSFMDHVPNGHIVPSPCGVTWPGLGHLEAQGGRGGLNQFGADFRLNNLTWSTEFCQMDSDGDGRTNGQELGDPQCVWTSGATPNTTSNITHPGICEPVSSPNCSVRPLPPGRNGTALYANQSDWLQHVCSNSSSATTTTVVSTANGGTTSHTGEAAAITKESIVFCLMSNLVLSFFLKFLL